jgi:hypothetical protein
MFPPTRLLLVARSTDWAPAGGVKKRVEAFSRHQTPSWFAFVPSATKPATFPSLLMALP